MRNTQGSSQTSSSANSNQDLHGNAPDKCGVALLLIDVINDLNFDGSEKLLELARPMADRLVRLKRRATNAGVPSIYVNDNFGRWRSNFKAQIEHCLHDDVPGKEIVRLLQPDDDDYFVLKPKHSAFFSTSLEILLDHLGAHTLIITGIATNICVLFTANDAYMRDYSVVIPNDCVAANTREENDYALEQMRSLLKADVRPSTELQFSDDNLSCLSAR